MTILYEQISSDRIQAVEDLGTATYPANYYEGLASFNSKILGYPQGCFLARIDEAVVGYIISFPYVLNKVYPINEHYIRVDNPTCLYIHDLCVSLTYRHQNIATSLVKRVLSSKITPQALVSVLNSESFWKRFGFITQRSFDYYGGSGSYMVRHH